MTTQRTIANLVSVLGDLCSGEVGWMAGSVINGQFTQTEDRNGKGYVQRVVVCG